MFGPWIKVNWMWSSRKWQDWCRLNINILGISELKWTGYYGWESLRRNGVALIVNKRVQNAVPACSLKNNRGVSAHFQGKPFNTVVTHIYAPTTDAKEATVQWFCEGLQHLLELTQTHTQRYPFHHRGLECKSKKSRDSWSNRQVWLWSTKWSWEKANRVLPREHTGHSKRPLPITQEKTLHVDITRWSIPKSD